MTIVHLIAGLQAGGAESVLYRLATGDHDSRHIVISFMDEGKYGPRLAAAGVPVHALKMRRSRLSLTGLRELRRLLRAYRPDVVQTWMYHADLVGGVAARLSGVPRVCWGVRSGEILWTRGQRLTAVIRAFNGLASWAVPDVVICNSVHAARLHKEIGYRPKTMRVVANGVDTDVFRPDANARERIRAEWGVAPEAALLGAIGRDTPYKDHETLIAALRLLRDDRVECLLVLVGVGMDAANRRLVDRIEGEGLHGVVRLAGERDDIPAVMNALDLCVMSSAAEGFPSVLIEAMACGVPCVTTNVGDAGAAVGETGWIVPPRDPAALARALSAALGERRDAAVFARRQASARERVVGRFSFAQMINGFQEAWKGARG